MLNHHVLNAMAVQKRLKFVAGHQNHLLLPKQVANLAPNPSRGYGTGKATAVRDTAHSA